MQPLRRREVPFPEVLRRVVELDPRGTALLVLPDVDQRPVVRRPLEGQARDAELTEPEGEGAAAVRFLDPAGQRTLAAGADAVGVGEVGPGEGAGGEDQRVLPGERVDLRRVLLEQRAGDQMASGADDLLARELLAAHVAGGEVDVMVEAHGVVVSA